METNLRAPGQHKKNGDMPQLNLYLDLKELLTSPNHRPRRCLQASGSLATFRVELLLPPLTINSSSLPTNFLELQLLEHCAPREDSIKSPSRFTNSQYVFLEEDLVLCTPHSQRRMKLLTDSYPPPFPDPRTGHPPPRPHPTPSASLSVNCLGGKMILPKVLIKLPHPSTSPRKGQA